jgi:hypothetical protein
MFHFILGLLPLRAEPVFQGVLSHLGSPQLCMTGTCTQMANLHVKLPPGFNCRRWQSLSWGKALPFGLITALHAD